MYIALAILAFGIIIAIHELGHFIAAKSMGVKVNEFAIGMGPKILWKQGKETLYSLRILPFGGFCSMEGEHEESEEPNPRAFMSQKRWKRIVILAAGSVANIIAAFIIVLALTLGADGFAGTTISDVTDMFPELGPSELMAGDRIVAINGERTFYHDDFTMFFNLHLTAGNPIIFTLERDGVYFEYERRPVIIDGEEQFRYRNLHFEIIEPSFFNNLQFAAYRTFNFIRMIRVSIMMMVSGDASVRDVAGPVGIVNAMHEVGQQSPTFAIALASIVHFTAFIGVNVAVVNLLPIPAMDGGRILFTVLTWVIEKITRRPLDPKYEGYINTGAMVLLLGLMVLVMYNDIARLVGW
ncbi:MAG: M50 family metallopeptidase [Oscillospiraceae bacterium]|nr:M50 family metallopeptidase [Oscillospiraceae bacterium]MCL2279758.1 M50 family metallopeptidase [Oscillospiraceae bacterium]